MHPDPNERGYIELYSKTIRLFYSSKLKAQAIFLFANETITMDWNAKIESTLEHECHMDPKDLEHKDLYQCMNYDLNENKPLNFKYVIDNFNDQYNFKKPDPKSKDMKGRNYVNDIVGMKVKISKKWNVYLMSLNLI